MRITDFLRLETIISTLHADSKEDVLAELVEPLTKLYTFDKTVLVKTLISRENLGSTGIGDGVAIPHAKFEGVNTLVASFGRSVKGVDFGSMDNKPAHLFFLLAAPQNGAAEHLKALARISRVFKDPLLKTALLKAESAQEIYDLIQEYDQRFP